MALRVAKRNAIKIKMGVSGPSGSGKSYSALLLAKGLVGSWDKIGVLCTEGGSADLYSDLGEYGVMEMEAPFHPDRFVKAINYFVEQGVECMIIDSATHEWDGEGGCLDIHSKMAGNSFTNWSKIKPLHKKFVDAINKADMHVITTTRRKQDYVLEENSKGKMTPKKVGMKEIQGDGFEYELTLALDIDMNHNALSSKDRTNLFADKPEFRITEHTGEIVKMWSEGKSVKDIFDV